jgi:RNA polymerase sigma factor (sigma-70 family)
MAASITQFFSHLPCWTSDAVLLQRYVHQRDEAAFAALVARHGNWVLRLCRRILGDAHAAEDAFQATFLILAQKAHSLKQPDALPAWLYGVARRVALKARTKSVRPRQLLDKTLIDARADPLTQVSARELLDILGEEVHRLSAAQRSAVVMCCLEGRPQEEAARMLGWTAGSLKGHLERGRRRLQDRLQRRGIGLSAALAVVEVSRGEATSGLLLQNTVKAALNGSLGSSAGMLASSVLKAMLWSKLAGVMTVVLTVVLAASTTAALVYCGPAADDPENKTPTVSAAPREGGEGEPQAQTNAFGDPLPDGALRRLGTLRLRHRQHIAAVAYSPDGSLLASSGWDEVIHFWNANTGESIRELTDPSRDSNLAIAFSPDGTKLASTGGSGRVRLWDVKSGKKLLDIKGHKDRAFGLVFAPNGRSFATAGYDGMVRVWDATSGAELHTFSSGVQSSDNSQPLAFSPDGQTLAAGLGETIWLWDVKTGEQRLVIRKAHGSAVLSLAFLDKDTLISGGHRHVDAGKLDGRPSVRGVGELRFWDAASGKKLRDLTENGPDQNGCSLAVSRNGELLAFSFQNEIRLWDLRANKLLRRLTDYRNSWGKGAHDLMFSPDGKRLAALMGDNVVHVWDTESGHRRLSYPEAHRTVIDSVAYSPDGRQAATGGRDGVVLLWDVEKAKQVGRLQFSDGRTPGVEVVAFSSDDRTLAAGGYELSDWKHPGFLKLWDRKTGAELWTQRLESRVSALAFSPDGKTVAVACGDMGAEARRRGAVHNEIRIYERDTGKKSVQWIGLTARVRSLVFSSDGRFLHSCGDARTLRVWDVSATKLFTEHRLNIERGYLHSVAFSPDGRLLATSLGFADTIVLWDAIMGTERSKLRVEKSMGSALAFSADGRVLATGSMGLTNVDKPFDYDLHLWDLLTEREIRTLRPGSTTVNALAFSPDGRQLLAGMDNGTGLIWNVASSLGNGRKPKGQIEEKELESLWAKLGGEDTSSAYEAIGALATAPKIALPFLRERLRPALPADPQRVRQLIADLDSNEFARRDAVYHELEALGDKVRPALRKALEGKPPLEQRKRLEALLAAPRTIRQPDLLRQVRAIQVLEMIGSEEAQRVLRLVAGGAAEARLTEEARASLQRLTTRLLVKP